MKNPPDALCLAETNNKPRDLHIDYKWVGKHRNGSKERVEIGMCVNSKPKIQDENLIDSKNDDFERLLS